MRRLSNDWLRGSLLTAVALTLIGAGVSYASLMPVFGWDVLGDWNIEWGRPFRALVLLDLMDETYSKYNYDMFRHSDLVTMPFATGILLFEKGAGLFCALLWLCCAVCIGIYVSKACGNNEFFPFIFILFFTIPLLENHYLIFGYSELWASLFLVLLIILVFSDFSSKFKILSIVLMMALLYFVKSSGIIYMAALSYSFLAAPLQSRFLASDRAWLIFEVLCFFLVSALLYKLGLNGLFDLAGRSIPLTTNPPTDVLLNFVTIMFVNQSFSILPLMVFICLCASSTNTQVFFIKRFLMASLLIVVAAMAFTETFFVHSRIGSDTSGSRFLLVLIPPAAYLLSLNFREFLDHIKRLQKSLKSSDSIAPRS